MVLFFFAFIYSQLAFATGENPHSSTDKKFYVDMKTESADAMPAIRWREGKVLLHQLKNKDGTYSPYAILEGTPNYEEASYRCMGTKATLPIAVQPNRKVRLAVLMTGEKKTLKCVAVIDGEKKGLQTLLIDPTPAEGEGPIPLLKTQKVRPPTKRVHRNFALGLEMGKFTIDTSASKGPTVEFKTYKLSSFNAQLSLYVYPYVWLSTRKNPNNVLYGLGLKLYAKRAGFKVPSKEESGTMYKATPTYLGLEVSDALALNQTRTLFLIPTLEYEHFKFNSNDPEGFPDSSHTALKTGLQFQVSIVPWTLLAGVYGKIYPIYRFSEDPSYFDLDPKISLPIEYGILFQKSLSSDLAATLAYTVASKSVTYSNDDQLNEKYSDLLVGLIWYIR